MVNRNLFRFLLVAGLLVLMLGCENSCVSRITSKAYKKMQTFGIKKVDLEFNEAMSEGDLDTAKRFLNEDADINFQFKRENGFSNLMMIAAGANYVKGLQFLLDNGADPNLRLNDGRTALMLAAERGNLEYVRRLLQAGADPSLVAGDGSTAYSLAAAAGHYEVVSLLENTLSEKKGTS